MSTVIGGPHRCNIHPDFPETDDEQVWKQHLRESDDHLMSGAVPCEVCGVGINFENIPDNGEPPKLKCADCYGKQEEIQQMVLNASRQQVQQNNQQQGEINQNE